MMTSLVKNVKGVVLSLLQLSKLFSQKIVVKLLYCFCTAVVISKSMLSKRKNVVSLQAVVKRMMITYHECKKVV